MTEKEEKPSATAKDILTEALRMYEEGGIGWCRFKLAEDSDGLVTDIANDKAVAHCLGGALLRALLNLTPDNKPPEYYTGWLMGNYSNAAYIEACKALLIVLGKRYPLPDIPVEKDFRTIAGFNDHMIISKDDVISILKEALQTL